MRKLQYEARAQDPLYNAVIHEAKGKADADELRQLHEDPVNWYRLACSQKKRVEMQIARAETPQDRALWVGRLGHWEAAIERSKTARRSLPQPAGPGRGYRWLCKTAILRGWIPEGPEAREWWATYEEAEQR